MVLLALRMDGGMMLEIPMWMMLVAAAVAWIALFRKWRKDRTYETGYQHGYEDALRAVRGDMKVEEGPNGNLPRTVHGHEGRPTHLRP